MEITIPRIKITIPAMEITIPGSELRKAGFCRQLRTGWGCHRCGSCGESARHRRCLCFRFGRDNRYLRAFAAEQQGDLEKAKVALREVLSVAPQSLDGYFLLGSVEFRQKNLEAAQESIQRVLDAVPANVQSKKLLASILIAGQKTSEAAEILESAVEINEDDVQLLTMLGNTYMLLREFDKASQVLGQAAALAPDAADIRSQLAVSKFGLGEGDAALREVSSALALDPPFTQADMVLTLMLMERGELEKAIEAARRFAEKQPDNPVPHNLMGSAYEGLADRDQAINSYQHALSIDPDFVAAGLNMARLDIQAGNESRAVARYQKILQRIPHQPDVMNRLARLSLRNGDLRGGNGTSGTLERKQSSRPGLSTDSE